MVSTRARLYPPPISPITPPTRKRPRPAPRPPKYPAWLSAAVVEDLEDDVLDIGEKLVPVTNISSHVERKIGGKVVFLTRSEDEERRVMGRAKKLRKERMGGKSRAARKRAWKRGGGQGRRRSADGKFE